MKISTLRQIIKEEISNSAASELLSLLAHPDFKQQLSILNNDSVNDAYENLYMVLMGIERNEPLNENTFSDAFMAGWNQSKANLGKGKIRGDVRDIDAWMEYSQGSGSEEDKEAFLNGWFKARTTTDLSDVEQMNESTSRTIIINSTEEWENLANELEGYKYSGSLKPVSANRGLIQLSNYAKYPYEVIIDDENQTIQFGKHSLK